MNPPYQADLPVALLAACFNKKATSYKFYWFLSIIQAVESGQTTISKKELFAGMIANAWYTINYFHVSFGVQDQLQRAIETLQEVEKLTIDTHQSAIQQQLVSTDNKISLKHLNYFNEQVPHWFLSPWFPKLGRAEIYEHSAIMANDCLYALDKGHITINPKWHAYLYANSGILKNFCYWKLSLYLQSKNPNVPDIPNKLIKPALRNSLTKQRKRFWDIVVQELGGVSCIYTQKILLPGQYAVEHFVPYAFVSHDLIWNLIPADPSFNSSKSDRLPPLDRYFDPFFELQQRAIQITTDKSPNNQYLQDYLSIFPDLSIFQVDPPLSRQRFKDQLQPLITIAANNGFEYLKL